MNSIPSEESNLIPYSFCPYCNNIPLIHLLSLPKPTSLKIECTCHLDEESNIKPFYISLSEYNEIIKKKTNQQSEQICKYNSSCKNKGEWFCIDCQMWICTNDKDNHQLKTKHNLLTNTKLNSNRKCKQHLEPFERYCSICKVDLCRKCLSSHNKTNKNHSQQVLDLLELENIIDVNQIIKDINEIPFKIEEYNSHKKDYVINQLKLQIELVEKAYQTNKEINETIITFIKSIYKTYSLFNTENTFNYNILSNTLFNCNLYIPQIEFNNNNKLNVITNDLIDFYNSQFVYGTNKLTANTIYRTEPIDEHKYSKDFFALIVLSNKNICLGYKDISIYSNKTFEEIGNIKLPIKKAVVSCICELSSNIIVIGSTNGLIHMIQLLDKDDNSKVEMMLMSKFKCNNLEIKNILAINKNSIVHCTEENLCVWNFDIVYSDDNKTLQLNEMKSKVLKESEFVISDIIIPSKLNEIVISSSIEGIIKLWNIKNENYELIEEHINCNGRKALTEIEGGVIIISSKREIILFDYIALLIKKKYTINENNIINSYCYLKFAKIIVMFFSDRKIISVNINTDEKQVIEIPEHVYDNSYYQIYNLISYGGRTLLSVDINNNISIWNI